MYSHLILTLSLNHEVYETVGFKVYRAAYIHLNQPRAL